MNPSPRTRTVTTPAPTRPGLVTREDVRTRARELAAIAGRHPPYVAQVDYEQAKREVTGESELIRQEEMLDGGVTGLEASKG